MHRFQKWRDVLQLAPNKRDVETIIRDYLATLAPELLAALPEKCQVALTDPVDVQAAAVTLLQAELEWCDPDDGGAVIHEIAHTFAAASVRITALHSKPLIPAAG